MNAIIGQQYPLFRLYQSLRDKLMNLLSTQDLEYRLPGDNPTWGELCREIGEVQVAYIESFRTFRQDFSYRHPDPEIAFDLERLKAWYAQLDEELYTVIANLSETDLGQPVEREPDFKVPPGIQLDIYKEALLIFYGKSSVYLKARKISPPEHWRHWIG